MQNSKLRDSGAKIIFGNEELVSQLLRNYSGMEILRNVNPEDIEDVTDRYIPMFEEERSSDVVKKIRLPGKEPMFLISLVEHKSYVDYNVTMQLLRYMVFIWTDYEREINKRNPGSSKAKSFRYPPILPIVYYEGSDKWTADMDFSNRILLKDVFRPFIPQFTYKLIQLNSYTKNELIEKKDELSLIMLINKLQNAEEFKVLELPENYLKDLSENASEEVLNIIAKVIAVILRKLKLSENEIHDFTDQIKERNMGMLFENFKGYDVPAVRREARSEGETLHLIKLVCKKLEKGKSPEQISEEELEENFDIVIKVCSAIKETGISDPETLLEHMKNKTKES